MVIGVVEGDKFPYNSRLTSMSLIASRWDAAGKGQLDAIEYLPLRSVCTIGSDVSMITEFCNVQVIESLDLNFSDWRYMRNHKAIKASLHSLKRLQLFCQRNIGFDEVCKTIPKNFELDFLKIEGSRLQDERISLAQILRKGFTESIRESQIEVKAEKFIIDVFKDQLRSLKIQLLGRQRMFKDASTLTKAVVGAVGIEKRYTVATVDAKNKVNLKIVDKYTRKRLTVAVHLGNGFPLVSSVASSPF